MRMSAGSCSSSLLRQLSRGDSLRKLRWSKRFVGPAVCDGYAEDEEWRWEESSRKKVIVVVDGSGEAKVALLWALSHVVNRHDTLTLLHVIDQNHKRVPEPRQLASSLTALCRGRRPEVEVEAVVVEGEKAVTIVSQARKLEASVLVMGPRKPSLFQRVFKRKRDDVVDYCIENAECLTLSVRKQSCGVGGYIINSRCQKNFWLLA